MSQLRVSRIVLFFALAASLMLILPASAVAQRIGFGVGFYGPVYPYGGYYYGPYGYPYGYPYAYYGGRPLGEVHVKSPDSNAQIYINGALAGRAHDLKRFYLVPGTYNFEQRIGTDVQKQRVYVIANRSLKIEFGQPGTPSPQPPPPPANAPAPPPPAGAPVPPPAPNSAPAPAPQGQMQ
jgi:hypothetical protein